MHPYCHICPQAQEIIAIMTEIHTPCSWELHSKRQRITGSCPSLKSVKSDRIRLPVVHQDIWYSHTCEVRYLKIHPPAKPWQLHYVTPLTRLCDSSYYPMWLLSVPYMTPLTTLCDSSHYTIWFLSLHYVTPVTTVCHAEISKHASHYTMWLLSQQNVILI